MIFNIIVSFFIGLLLTLSIYQTSLFILIFNNNLILGGVVTACIISIISYFIIKKVNINKKDYYGKSKIVYISIIICFLASGFIGINFSAKISEREKRTLANFPNRLPFHEEFPNEFNKYIDDRVNYRDKMIDMYAFVWKLLPFDDVIDENVKGFVGKDNFIFGNAYNNTITRYAGLITYSDEQLKEFKKHIDKVIEYCNLNNILFYLMIPPGKQVVYADHYSEFIKRNTKEHIYNTIDDFLIENIDEYIPVYDKLMEERKNYQMFYREDSHWTSIGAYFAYYELAKRIKKDIPDFQILEQEHLYRCDVKAKLRDSISLVPWHKYNYPATNEFCVKDNAPKNPYKIMIIGDSYTNRELFKPFYLSNFIDSKIYRIYHTSPLAFKKEIEEFKPDIILWEQLWTYTENMMNGFITYDRNSHYIHPRPLEEFLKERKK